MRIKLGTLRRIIREAILEMGGAKPSKPQPTQNPSPPGPVIRQQLGRISIQDMYPPEEISPHLRPDSPSALEDEDPWGPVPPTSEKPTLSTVDYARDWGVLPTGGNIGR
jgi:hypothetical protein